MRPVKYKYCLTDKGIERCKKNEFYLQANLRYKGYTKAIFNLLYQNNNIPLTKKRNIRKVENT